MKTAEYWINTLDLEHHPEGGYFREVYQSSESIPADVLPERYTGQRAYSTSIYFLLKQGEPSCMHRIQSDEIWHFYAGAGTTLHLIHSDGTYNVMKLGAEPDRDQHFQHIVPASTWFSAEVTAPGEFSLMGCTVAPGFEFQDFELGRKEQMMDEFPQYRDLFNRMCV